MPGFVELYAVSDDGQVKSLGRTTIGGSRGGPCVKIYRAKLLSPVISGGQRTSQRQLSRVNLFYQTNGAGARKKAVYIFDLVAAAFDLATARRLPEPLQKKRKVAIAAP